MGNLSIGGRWKQEEVEHINVLEMKAILFGLKSFCREPDKHVQVYTDNVTAYNYVKKLGGVRSRRCNQVAQEIWSWAELNRNWISVSFVPGVLNLGGSGLQKVH